MVSNNSAKILYTMLPELIGNSPLYRSYRHGFKQVTSGPYVFVWKIMLKIMLKVWINCKSARSPTIAITATEVSMRSLYNAVSLFTQTKLIHWSILMLFINYYYYHIRTNIGGYNIWQFVEIMDLARY